GVGGAQHGVRGEGAEAAGGRTQHRVSRGEALHALADRGDHARGLEPHRERQRPGGAEQPLAALGVGRIDPGGAHLDPDLPGPRGGDLAVAQLLVLGTAVRGGDEHGGGARARRERCGAHCFSARERRRLLGRNSDASTSTTKSTRIPMRRGSHSVPGAAVGTWAAADGRGPVEDPARCETRRRVSSRIALTITRSTEASWISMPTAMVTPPANTPASRARTVSTARAMFWCIT